jgi:hypothetical protein
MDAVGERPGMDPLRDFLNAVRDQGCAQGNMLGLLHVLIGRQIKRADGTLVSSGLTWREAAARLKKARWKREAVRDFGLDPATLPARDRQRFWYSAIAQGNIDSATARKAGDELAKRLVPLGFIVSAAPRV